MFVESSKDKKKVQKPEKNTLLVMIPVNLIHQN